jgi:parallel beta-helix repeat protein
MRRILVLCVLLLTVAAPHVSGQSERAVLRVPGAFPTIQDAVDAARPGDIIQVAAGTYCENVVISTRGIRLRAAPAGPNGGAILSGACKTGGYGFHVLGASAEDPVSGVEISGFTVEGFDTGILLQFATGSRIHLNEVRENVYRGSSSPSYGRAQGIVLLRASFNDITQNWIHDNGHLGIGLLNGSNGNLIRANRLIDNQAQQGAYPGYACSLMLWGATNSGNRIVENEIRGALGFGLMIGSGIQTGNLVAQNRIHGHAWEGIVVYPGSFDNVIQQNNVRGNGLEGWPDMAEFNHHTMNTWERNLGTCEPGNAGCK